MVKYKTIRVGLKRDVRHARYNVSQCWTELTADVDPDDLENSYKEVYDDVVYIVEEMVEEEKKNYKEKMDAIKNQ